MFNMHKTETFELFITSIRCFFVFVVFFYDLRNINILGSLGRRIEDRFIWICSDRVNFE